MQIPNFRKFPHLFVEAAKAWSADYAPSMGAAISYYTVFSLAPLLVIVIAVAGAVFGRAAVTGQIVAQVGGLIGDQGAALVQKLVIASSNRHQGLVAGIVSAFVLVLGATSVFTELQTALDRIWHVPASQKPTGVWSILRARLLSFGVILGLVFLLMVSLTVSAALAAFGGWIGGLMPGATLLAEALNFVLSLAIATVLFAFIFRMLPSTRLQWDDVWIGAIVTAILFEIGKYLIGLYLGKSRMTQTFAAAGSLVVMLAWVYYAAQIFLLGAEFTKVYAREHGSRRKDVQAGAAAASAAPTAPAGPAHGGHHPIPGFGHHAPAPSPAIAKLEETRERLELEVPPRYAELKQKAKRASAAGGAALALGIFGLKMVGRYARARRSRKDTLLKVGRFGVVRRGA